MGRWAAAFLIALLSVPFLAMPANAGVGPLDTSITAAFEEHGTARVIVVLAEAKGTARLDMPGLEHRYRTFPAATAEVTPEGLDLLRKDPRVKAIILDTQRRVMLTDSIPLIKAPEAHRTLVNGTNLTGAGETICVIDTGVDKSHPAFAGRIIAEYDFVNNDNDTSDDDGHGTHVAGIALGNSENVNGAAPGANLAIAKVCDGNGLCWDSAILAGIDYCNDHSATHNISVISGSIGGGGPFNSTSCSSDSLYPLLESVLQDSLDRGIIPVFASGNDAFTTGISYPACSPRVISVGSTTKADAISVFSNRGGDRLDIYAPGQAIISALAGGGIASGSGTSMATPHVAGALAILQQNERAHNRTLNLTRARAVLRETGKPVGTTARVDIDNAVRFLDSGLVINRTTGALANASAGTQLLLNATITDYSCVTLRENLIGIDSAACPQYNTSASLRIAGLRVYAEPLLDDQPCPADVCTGINYSAGTLQFNVTGFSSYSAQEQELISIALNVTPDPVVKGRELNITIAIANNGNETAQNTSILLAANGTITAASHNWSGSLITVGNVTPGTALLVNATLRVSTALPNGTTMTIAANASYSSTQTGFSAANTTAVNISGVPDLSITITDSPDPIAAGADFSYSIGVENTGDEIAYDAILLVTLNGNLSFVNSTRETADNRTFLLGNMTPGATMELNITVTSNGTAAHTTMVQVDFTYAGIAYAASANETTSFPPVPAVPAPTVQRSGGGGGGGVASKTYTLNRAGEGGSGTFTLYHADKVVFRINGTQHAMTILDITRSAVRLSVASQGINLSKNLNEDSSIRMDGSVLRIELVNLTYPSAKVKVTLDTAIETAGEGRVPETAQTAQETAVQAGIAEIAAIAPSTEQPATLVETGEATAQAVEPRAAPSLLWTVPLTIVAAALGALALYKHRLRKHKCKK